ncbi:unnamed protein product [Pedinophyceae sp. YPF-701]|nr:unnamed protein product [Pedinophyceae sp. YPF-701]
MADFYDLEAMDAVRLTWNVWPNSKVEAAKCQMPFVGFYTPNKEKQDLMVCPYDAIPCRSCGSVLNPYARVDFQGKMWTCPFCMQRNQFPPHYAEIAENNLPAELFAQHTTIEYTTQSQSVAPPAYLFVMDTCVTEEELNAARIAVQQAISEMDERSLVGLVTFGTHVQVHELGPSDLPRSYIFQGGKEYTTQKIRDSLGLGRSANARQQQQQQPGTYQPPQQRPSVPLGLGRFLVPLADCEFTLANVLEDLTVDPFPVVSDHRPQRCTGNAVQVASAVMSGSVVPGMGAARVMLLAGGPVTEGGGKMVGQPLEDPIRSHKDLRAGSCPYHAKACAFFRQLGDGMAAESQVLDVFVCSLEQVGLAEMKACVEATGGVVVMTDTFQNPVFRESFQRMFARDDQDGALHLSSDATFEVVTSRDIRVQGLIGPAHALPKRGTAQSAVSDKPIGEGGTTVWRMPGLDAHSTLAVFFEITGTYKDHAEQAAAAAANCQFFLQFICRYIHSSGQARVRVTTITRRWTDGSNLNDLVAGFDQEAAAVAMARLASWKMENEEDFDATRWLDRSLISLCSRFGDYRRDDPGSFQLAPQLSMYPQFMFYLRRSQFVQVFGHSPDETAYFRLMLDKETVGDAITMIQPPLMAYGFQGPPEPVMLDVASILPERILLLDSYFTVVVFHGTTIAQWRKAEYHLQPEHAAFAQLLEAPKADARAIIDDRFPAPRLVDCDQNGSQARFLLAKLNPSSTYSNAQGMTAEVIMTDDVSLDVFMEHLRKLCVQAQ